MNKIVKDTIEDGNLVVDVCYIDYKGKRYKIPKPFDQCFFGSEPTKEMTIHNRFSDETSDEGSARIPAFAVAIYDTIIGAEQTEDYTTMQKGLTWFQKNFPNAYYQLLD
tara:strand:- start:15 stop:341 length:327 start_codon:yes stop_codon:yes gene_type:complete